MNRRQVLTYGAFGLGATALAPGLTWGRPRAARPAGGAGSDRPDRHPPRHRHRSGRQQPGRVVPGPGGARPAPGASRWVQGRRRADQAAGGALPPLRPRPGRPGRRRGDRRRRRHPLDRPSRQHESRLVQLRHRPRHSPGQRPPRRAAASRARSDALPPSQRGDHRSRRACGSIPGRARSAGRTRMPTAQDAGASFDGGTFLGHRGAAWRVADR